MLSYLLSYCTHYNIANRLGQKIRATNRYGDEDVWHFFQNAPDDQKNHGWVIVRDLKADLAYVCFISTWSDSGTEREVVLSDVSVYSNTTGDYLYDAKHIYLSRNRDDLMIEVPPAHAEGINGYLLQPDDKESPNGGQESAERGKAEEGGNQQAPERSEAADQAPPTKA